MKNWLRSHPLSGYIALAYAGSWILWLPTLLGRKNLGLLPYELPTAASVVLNQLALFAGPFLASLVMTRLTTGSLKIWTASLLRWRVPPVAYLLALVTIPAAVIAVLAILPGETAGGPELTGPALDHQHGTRIRSPRDPRPQCDQLGVERVGEGDWPEGDEPVAGGAGTGRSGGDRRRRDPGPAGIPKFSVIPEGGNGHAPETGSHPHGSGMHVQDDAPRGNGRRFGP